MIHSIYHSSQTQMLQREEHPDTMLRDKHGKEKINFSSSISTNQQESHNMQSFLNGKTINDIEEQQ